MKPVRTNREALGEEQKRKKYFFYLYFWKIKEGNEKPDYHIGQRTVSSIKKPNKTKQKTKKKFLKKNDNEIK